MTGPGEPDPSALIAGFAPRESNSPCPDENQLAAFVEHGPAGEQDPVERHLAHCDDCRQLVEVLHESFESPTPPVRPTSQRPRLPPAVGIAVAAGLLFAALLWWRGDSTSTGIQGLVAELPDDASRQLFSWTQDPKLALADLERRAAPLRAAGEERILAPRATIATNTPTVRFEVPPPDPSDDTAWTYLVRITDTQTAASHEEQVVQALGAVGPVELSWPTEKALEEERGYRVEVMLDPAIHPGLEDVFRPGSVDFRVGRAGEAETLRRSIEEGDDATASLLRATVLLAHHYVLDAIAELDRPGTTESRDGSLALAAELLLAEARLRLGESLGRDTLESLAKRVGDRDVDGPQR